MILYELFYVALLLTQYYKQMKNGKPNEEKKLHPLQFARTVMAFEYSTVHCNAMLRWAIFPFIFCLPSLSSRPLITLDM